jgi:CDP-diacylglycerol--serine O-phosphatidyltransferase
MKRIIRSVPNFITTLNLVSGSLAVVLAAEGRPGYAAILIVCASLFDFLDGFSARLLKAYSETGKQLDSLADVISFGVAPGVLAYVLMKRSMPGLMIPMADIHASIQSWLLLLSPFLIPVFSALRLAKFNLDPRQTVSFLGMPTPANALLWASFGMISDFGSSPEVPILLFTSRNLLLAVLITSLLLVSELPMFSLKFAGMNLRDNWYRYIFLAVSLFLLVFTGIYGLAVIVLLYIALSVSFYLLKIRL